MIRLCAFADEYSKQIDEQIIGLNENGIHLIELRNVDGKNVADISLEEAKACYEKLHKAGIEVWSIGSPLGKVNIDCDFEEYKQKIHHICKIAQIMHADKIRMFSFFHAENQAEKVYEYLNEMVAIGKEYGVLMYHENEKEIYGDTIEHVLNIALHVKGLHFIYDPANYLQCHQSSQEALDKVFDLAGYFHIKDVIVETEQLVPAGDGDGMIKELVQKIDKDVVLTVEPHLAVFEGYAAIDGAKMNHKYHYTSNKEAFNAAVAALKQILTESGYKCSKRGYQK